ncbi:DNA primase [Sphingomonadaceae bacterium]|nr:DNA primase [Sphingomonadaceae bacterium]
MALTPQWLDELRARTTLSAVIMRTDKLQRAGREWKACCPFHSENTPSFTVSDEKGFYHCFGCGAHGDVIRWMTDQRGLSFMDAVKELAEQAGMEVPAPDPKAAQRAEQRAGLADVTQAAQEWFVRNLAAPEGKQARDYLEARGFNQRTIERFGFGFAPDGRQALKGALSDFDEALLVESGMRIAVDDKDPYDRFRARLMLPIQDTRGRVIGFGGRILDKETKAPKYLNSPDTPLFDKGRNLYNLHRAAPASRQTDRMIVVEGYMDVIALAAAGIEDAVAPMGTALTETQIELLWRSVNCPILCFDGDAAGQKAAMRAVERVLPLLRPAHSLSIIRMPTGLDPDDYINQRGVKAMEDLLSRPASLLGTLWDFESAAAPLNSPEDKAGLKARLLTHVDNIGDQDIRALYKRELLERFSAYAFPPREKKPWQPNKKWQPGAKAANPTLSADSKGRLNRATSGGQRDTLTAAIIAGLQLFPDQIGRHAETLTTLGASDPSLTPTVEMLLDAAETLDPADNSPISDGLGQTARPDKHRFAFLQEGTDPQVARDDLAEAVSLLVEGPALEAALEAATARFETDPEGAFAEQQRLLKRKLEFVARLGQMASDRAGRSAEQGSGAHAPSDGAAENGGADTETE